MKSEAVGPVLEDKVKDAIADELKRQAEIRPDSLSISRKGNRVSVQGEVDLDDLSMVVIGSLAGGP